jgi:hypothetical protein
MYVPYDDVGDQVVCGICDPEWAGVVALGGVDAVQSLFENFEGPTVGYWVAGKYGGNDHRGASEQIDGK